MRTLACASTVLIAFLATRATLRAQELPLVSDRPDFTESAVTIVPGGVQAEAGYSFSRSGGGVETHSLGELLLRIGMIPNVELRLGVNSYLIQSSSGGNEEGFEDAFLGTKVQLLEPALNPSASLLRPGVAVLLGTSLPTGHEAFGGDEINPEAKLALAWDLGERLSLGSNFNVASVHEDGERFGQVSGSAALGISLTERVGAFVEYFGFSRQSPDGPVLHFIDGGVTLLTGEDLQLDVRAGLGLDEVRDYFLGIGFAWRIRSQGGAGGGGVDYRLKERLGS